MKITAFMRNKFISNLKLLDDAIFSWFWSFEEHTSSCDVCTLTWADDYCEDFKLFLSFFEWEEIEVRPIGGYDGYYGNLGEMDFVFYWKDLQLLREYNIKWKVVNHDKTDKS